MMTMKKIDIAAVGGSAARLPSFESGNKKEFADRAFIGIRVGLLVAGNADCEGDAKAHGILRRNFL